jgi:hypothetical protein
LEELASPELSKVRLNIEDCFGFEIPTKTTSSNNAPSDQSRTENSTMYSQTRKGEKLMVVYKCDLCGQVRECLQKEINHRNTTSVENAGVTGAWRAAHHSWQF